MTDNFYRTFEDIHRGPRELITERLGIYLEYIQPFLYIYPDSAQVVDLGCGRGEWLEILINEGFSAKGVDLDEGMLQVCRDLLLPVEHSDALSCLRQLEDESKVAVSGFHFIEHVPFEYLRDIVTEAYRILKPGGLVIFETPNAENLVVGTNNFYLDPTHNRPIPHQLLKFLTEHSGFHRNKILRLQETTHLFDSQDCSLEHVLYGVSPDYAVIAQKPAVSAITEQFDEIFERERGISLFHSARRYDHNLRDRLSDFSQAIEKNSNLIKETNEKLHQIDERFYFRHDLVAAAEDLAKTKTDLELSRIHERNRLREIQDLNNELQARRRDLDKAHRLIHALYQSYSWKVTAPCRIILKFILWLLKFPRKSVKTPALDTVADSGQSDAVNTMTPTQKRFFKLLNRSIARKRDT